MRNSRTSLIQVEEKDLIEVDENKVINDKSIIINFTQEDNLTDYTCFYDNKEFLINTQIRIFHSIIYCNQKLFLFNEICFYCDKILCLDAKDWVARLKRGLHRYFSQDFQKAESDFKVALEECPEKEHLMLELNKLA